MWGLWATSINCSGFWIQAPHATCLSHEQYLALEVLLFCPFHATTQSSCFSCTGLVYRCPFSFFKSSSAPAGFPVIRPYWLHLDPKFHLQQRRTFWFPSCPWVVLPVEPHTHPGRWWWNCNSDLVTPPFQHSWSLPVAHPLRRCRQDRAGTCSPAVLHTRPCSSVFR